MRLFLSSIALVSLLSAGSGCASYCCDSYCGGPCGAPSCGPSYCGGGWTGQAGNCCDSWMDGTDACVDGFCQHNSRVKGLLKESYHSSRQTLKDLYNPPRPEFCVSQCGAGQCSTGQCGSSQCGAGGCQSCEQFGPPEPPTDCSTSLKVKGRRPVFMSGRWKPNWKPDWKFPWKKSDGCLTCGSSGGCSCGAGSHEYPAGYAASAMTDEIGMPNPNQFAAGPEMVSPENYFVPPTEYGANGSGAQQYGAQEYGAQQPVPQVQQGLPPMNVGPAMNGGQPYAGPGMVEMTPAQPLPAPLPESSPRGSQWRAVSTYRESFPAPPAAEMGNGGPQLTPSKVLPPLYDEGDEFEPPLIIESK